jgi:hypothetical protein
MPDVNWSNMAKRWVNLGEQGSFEATDSLPAESNLGDDAIEE